MAIVEIVFDGGDEFFPRQTVSGTVRCVITEPFDLRGISVEFNGTGKVHWTETYSSTTDTEFGPETTQEHRYISHSEEYYSKFFDLFGLVAPVNKKNREVKLQMQPGEHEFKFSFVLPPCLPSSYTDAFLQIRNTATVTITRPWASDIVCEKPFVVHNISSLNNSLLATINTEKVEGKKLNHIYWRLFGPSDVIKCRCWLPKRFYVPGEEMPFSAEIENLTSRTMKGSCVKLIQAITYRCKKSTKKFKKTLCKEKRPVFERSDCWSDYKITIPPEIPPSPFACTQLVDVTYELKFEVDPGLFFRKLVVSLPIMIGTIFPRVETLPPGVATGFFSSLANPYLVSTTQPSQSQ